MLVALGQPLVISLDLDLIVAKWLPQLQTPSSQTISKGRRAGRGAGVASLLREDTVFPRSLPVNVPSHLVPCVSLDRPGSWFLASRRSGKAVSYHGEWHPMYRSPVPEPGLPPPPHPNLQPPLCPTSPCASLPDPRRGPRTAGEDGEVSKGPAQEPAGQYHRGNQSMLPLVLCCPT